jgi:hypothetical protein
MTENFRVRSNSREDSLIDVGILMLKDVIGEFYLLSMCENVVRTVANENFQN